MKRFLSWRFWLTIILLTLSVLTYLVHYVIFRDSHHIFIYMIGDVAFLFIDVLLVILIIERLLSQREKRLLLNKLNMVIGMFFSEVGLGLLKRFSSFISNASDLAPVMEIKPQWSKKDFQKAAEAANRFSYETRVDKPALCELQGYLNEKREFLLRLLENPNLLEHERFTDLLWAVFHLAEELGYRSNQMDDLPQADYEHLAQDLKRAYSQLAREWILYAGHLKHSYPFLFSLAARINPFSPSPSPIIS
ncbi:MAG: hypothetical protein QHH14_02005 [Clostridiales bacterium]|nr:hypothetical protein [Clostridiales bacterium]